MKSGMHLTVTLLVLSIASAFVWADDPAREEKREAGENRSKPRLIKLSKEDAVWVDPQRKLVVVDGQIALTEGPLEMFACPKGTKEHESLVAVHSTAQVVHAGLLAVGAVPGHPVRFAPEYQRAEGPVIDIWILWQDDKGKHKVRAQELVKNVRTEKAMKHDWVFGGSGFYTDESSGKRYYHADGGDFICLSNFSTAMMDLPIKSSQANDALLFTAFTDRVPPRGTKVRMVLIPRAQTKGKQSGGDAPAGSDSDKERVVEDDAEKEQ